MALKELIFMALVGVSMMACPNRDCSCADKSFGECNVPTTVANEVHTTNRELCIANCDLFHSIGGCDWMVFKGTTTKTNCLMFTNEFEDMTEYLESCNLENFAIFQTDGSCMIDESNSQCGGPFCPTCTACKEDDPCEQYHQTNCVVNPKPISEYPATKDIETCRLACIANAASNPTTSYGGFDYKDELCVCYDSGDRSCQYEAIQYGVTEADIAACQGGGEVDPPKCLTDADCTAPLLCNPAEGCVSGCRAHDECTATEFCDCPDAANDNLGCDDGTKPGECQGGCRNEGDVCADANGVGGNCQDHQCIATGTPSIESLLISTATCSGCTARGGHGAVLTFQNKITNDVVRPCSTQILDSSNFQSNGEVPFEDDPLGGCLSEPTNSVAEVTVDWVGTGSWVPNTIMVVTKPVGFSYCCLNSGDAASETNPLTISCDDC